jgi:hypothetical protein
MIVTICGTSGFVSPCTTVEISRASPTVPYITAAISAHRCLASRQPINASGSP